MANEIISTIIQLLLVTLIPVTVYVIRNKSLKDFFVSIGFKKPNGNWILYSILYGIIAMILFSVPLFYLSKIGALNSKNLATNNIMSQNFSIITVIQILVYAVIKTGLSEEIFFRGFIAKKLIDKFGFKKGNSIQAIIFGIIHGGIFINYGIVAVLISILFPTLVGFGFGYMNEKMFGGSIIPSWSTHAIANIISPLIMILLTK
ncbi:MAG: CPBP family intramembrane metalloprotease [Firmicutes bacterium]|nr:CPBP family intramembrane metalloprotease [Bacillota bacterium]